MKKLNNKVAAITGAASGIGRCLAIELAKEVCHLALADINAKELEETVRLAKNNNIRITQHIVDVSKKDQVAQYAKEAAEQHGSINIVVNNAGVTVMATVEHVSYEDFEWLMGINFWGVVYGTKEFLPYIKQAEEGHIVNISSIFGLLSVPIQSAYHSAKFAVRGFTESLRQELKREYPHVKVSCVHPGSIKTNIAKAARVGEAGKFSKRADTTVKKFDQMALTTPQKAARDIIKGIKTEKERILIGPDTYIFDSIQRMFPEMYPTVMKKIQQLLSI